MDRNSPDNLDLSKSQLNAIVDCLAEQIGTDSSRAEFADCAFQVFEEISGLELISDSEANDLISKLWSLYHEQDQ